MKEERLLPVGTKVFDVRYGWGEVVNNEDYAHFRICVKFDGETATYNIDGVNYSTHKYPLLSLTEYTLEKGGFTPISEYWTKPKVGDWGYFWNNEDCSSLDFGKLLKIQTKGDALPYYSSCGAYFRHFSHDIPDHIKKQMQQ